MPQPSPCQLVQHPRQFGLTTNKDGRGLHVVCGVRNWSPIRECLVLKQRKVDRLGLPRRLHPEFVGKVSSHLSVRGESCPIRATDLIRQHEHSQRFLVIEISHNGSTRKLDSVIDASARKGRRSRDALGSCNGTIYFSSVRLCPAGIEVFWQEPPGG